MVDVTFVLADMVTLKNRNGWLAWMYLVTVVAVVMLNVANDRVVGVAVSAMITG